MTNDEWFLEQVRKGRLTVTPDGVVTNNDTGRVIGAMGSGGYPKISLTKFKDEDGRWIIAHMQIHRLVWIVFNGLVPEGLQLNHKDCNKNNPRLENLELVTQTENASHAVVNGRYTSLFQPGNKHFMKSGSYKRKHGL
jgi:hypothetical protein